MHDAPFCVFALSVTCGDTSPKGRGKSPVITSWLPRWGSWRVSA